MWRIDPDLKDIGLANRPNIDVFKSTHVRFAQAAHLAISDGLANFKTVVDLIIVHGFAFGSPLLLALRSLVSSLNRGVESRLRVSFSW